MLKRILSVVVIVAVLCAVVTVADAAKKCCAKQTKCVATKPLPNKNMVHIAIVVEDVEKASKAWGDLLGIEVPQWSLNDPPEKSNILYRGKTTDARLKTTFLTLDNLRIELMEPVGGPSTWMDFLQKNGAGVHHIAFDVKGIEDEIANIEKKGMPLVQRGEWTVYTGGCYTYFESEPQLGVVLELLESY
jgi:methylmalonyl-CoA epimerase